MQFSPFMIEKLIRKNDVLACDFQKWILVVLNRVSGEDAPKCCPLYVESSLVNLQRDYQSLDKPSFPTILEVGHLEYIKPVRITSYAKLFLIEDSLIHPS